MIVVKTTKELKPLVAKGSYFVPTMGAIHKGHLSLVKQACKHQQQNNQLPVIASIFVNPQQMDSWQAYQEYPRKIDDDLQLLASQNINVAFLPELKEIYPFRPGFQIQAPECYNQLEGSFRQGHFNAVSTVVLKLFHITNPKIAFFGQKDLQQLLLIQDLVNQLAMPIKILAVETVREEDGLAYSSRNQMLSTQQRSQAGQLYKQLSWIKNQVLAGNHEYDSLSNISTKNLRNKNWKVDYIAIKNVSDLCNTSEKSNKLFVLGAASLGAVRLIDNLEIQ